MRLSAFVSYNLLGKNSRLNYLFLADIHHCADSLHCLQKARYEVVVQLRSQSLCSDIQLNWKLFSVWWPATISAGGMIWAVWSNNYGKMHKLDTETSWLHVKSPQSAYLLSWWWRGHCHLTARSILQQLQGFVIKLLCLWIPSADHWASNIWHWSTHTSHFVLSSFKPPSSPRATVTFWRHLEVNEKGSALMRISQTVFFK